MAVSRAQALQQPEQPPPSRSDQRLAAEITAVLATAVTAAAIVAALRSSLKAAGIAGSTLQAVAAMVLGRGHTAPEPLGPAGRYVASLNVMRSGAFFLAACRRVQRDVNTARSKGEPVMAALQDALRAEQRYFAQHAEASDRRVQAATAVDSAASVHGNLLGWNAVKDSRTTAECYAADHKNFRADRPPLIGYPGATHPMCRCFPSAPFEGAPLIP